MLFDAIDKIKMESKSRVVSLGKDEKDRDSSQRKVQISPFIRNNDGLEGRFDREKASPERKNIMHNNMNVHQTDILGSGPSVDQKLVARVQKGDKKAFDLLVIKYQGKVASIVSRYINDHHEIADVTQEAFIKAYRALKGFRGDSAFYTWVYRIAINCAKNHLATKARRAPAVDIDIGDAEYLPLGQNLRDIESPESVLSKEQLERVLKKAMMDLPEDLRVALTLREFEGLSYEDISSIMACPIGTVRSRIFRAREFVDVRLEAEMGYEA